MALLPALVTFAIAATLSMLIVSCPCHCVLIPKPASASSHQPPPPPQPPQGPLGSHSSSTTNDDSNSSSSRRRRNSHGNNNHSAAAEDDGTRQPQHVAGVASATNPRLPQLVQRTAMLVGSHAVGNSNSDIVAPTAAATAGAGAVMQASATPRVAEMESVLEMGDGAVPELADDSSMYAPGASHGSRPESVLSEAFLADVSARLQDLYEDVSGADEPTQLSPGAAVLSDAVAAFEALRVAWSKDAARAQDVPVLQNHLDACLVDKAELKQMALHSAEQRAELERKESECSITRDEAVARAEHAKRELVLAKATRPSSCGETPAGTAGASSDDVGQALELTTHLVQAKTRDLEEERGKVAECSLNLETCKREARASEKQRSNMIVFLKRQRVQNHMCALISFVIGGLMGMSWRYWLSRFLIGILLFVARWCLRGCTVLFRAIQGDKAANDASNVTTSILNRVGRHIQRHEEQHRAHCEQARRVAADAGGGIGSLLCGPGATLTATTPLPTRKSSGSGGEGTDPPGPMSASDTSAAAAAAITATTTPTVATATATIAVAQQRQS